jgi:class 3 adenylate cyclase
MGGVGGAPIRSALLLDGQVIAPGLAPEARAALGRLLEPGGRDAVSTFRVDGVPYLVLDKVLNPDSAFPPVVELGLYPLDAARREQARLRRLVLGAGTAALVLAFALSAALAHGLTVPVRDLIRGTHEIRGGNYAHRVAVRGRDELAGLGAAFNDMAVGLAQKDRYRHVLDAVTDRRVAEELLAGAIELGGELRDVGILFCDIRGFTALTERMAPTEVIALLNEHMTAMTAVVHADHGVVDKFVGDQIMAIFGAPIARGTEMRDMAHAALRMVAERARLNAGAARAIEIGVGMAAGQVVAGCMGSRQRLNYTVLGERVNLAARLCQAAGPMDVVMDEVTRERLGAAARAEPLAPLVAKGFSGPVQAYHLLGLVEGA